MKTNSLRKFNKHKAKLEKFEGKTFNEIKSAITSGINAAKKSIENRGGSGTDMSLHHVDKHWDLCKLSGRLHIVEEGNIADLFDIYLDLSDVLSKKSGMFEAKSYREFENDVCDCITNLVTPRLNNLYGVVTKMQENAGASRNAQGGWLPILKSMIENGIYFNHVFDTMQKTYALHSGHGAIFDPTMKDMGKKKHYEEFFSDDMIGKSLFYKDKVRLRSFLNKYGKDIENIREFIKNNPLKG
jgi:hypothetical protein